MKDKELMPLLIADDDPEDCMFAVEALKELRIANPIVVVQDGEELMDYLRGKGKYAAARPARPALILLDLRMPKKDGFEAIREIKSSPELRQIPVIVLTTSRATPDISTSYDLGVNSFITKPDTFDELVEAMKVLRRYWFGVVELPPQRNGG